jgi:hypothetical protein
MGDVRVISTADALCGSHAFQHNFQLFAARRCALCRKFQVSLESPDRHSLPVAVIPPSHTQIGAECTEILGVPTTKNPEDWSQEITQASWMSLYVLSTFRRKSGSGAVWQCRENEVVPHHAWTTCVVDEEEQVPRALPNHSPKNDGYTALDSLLGKTSGPKSWSCKMHTQTLIRPYLCRHWFLNICLLRYFCSFIYYAPLNL